MALSDTHTKNVGSWWRLRLTWTASQNTGNNTSTITSKLYWEAQRDGVGRVVSSSSRGGNTKIDGATETFSNTVGLSEGGSKLLNTHTRTVTHDSDGTLTIPISGTFDLGGLSLSGTDYGSQTVSANITLNTIPRESTLSSGDDWKAGSNATVSVKRASTAFSHNASIWVEKTANQGDWDHIKTVPLSTSQTSVSTAFSAAQHEEIFQHLNGRSSARTQVILYTDKGSSNIGSKTYNGTVTAPNRSTTSFNSAFNVGDDIGGTISQENSAFTHTIQLIMGGTTYTLLTKTAATNWTYNTASIATALFGKLGNNKSLAGTLRIITYYGNQQVRSHVDSTITMYAPSNSAPSFSTGQVSYDNNGSTTAITGTGNDTYIIQGKSTFRAQIISHASPKNGATIVNYILTVNGVSVTKKYAEAIGYHNLGTINSASNVTFSVKAVDSRGFSTTVSKTVTMIPYREPNVMTGAERENGFEKKTTLSLRGSISPVNVGTSPKNSIVSAQYQYRQQGVGNYTALENFTYTLTMPNYTATDVVLQLDNLKAWDVRVIVKDKLGTNTYNMIVPVGQPILFIDSVKKSMGFNDYPLNDNEWRINGRIIFGSNIWSANAGGEADLAGALILSNSDITQVNGIYFNDVSSINNGEGLLFLREGRPSASTVKEDYHNFYVRDGMAYLDGIPIGNANGNTFGEQLWKGAMYLQEGQVITPSRPLRSCPNGWMLVWSNYSAGVEQNNNWQFTYIPKSHDSGGGIKVGLWMGEAPDYKYIYASNTQITGNARNNATDSVKTVVLRFVYTF